MNSVFRKRKNLKLVCVLVLTAFITSCSSVTPKPISPEFYSSSNSLKLEDGKIPLDIALDTSEMKVEGFDDYTDYVRKTAPGLLKSDFESYFRSVTLASDRNVTMPSIVIKTVEAEIYSPAKYISSKPNPWIFTDSQFHVSITYFIQNSHRDVNGYEEILTGNYKQRDSSDPITRSTKNILRSVEKHDFLNEMALTFVIPLAIVSSTFEVALSIVTVGIYPTLFAHVSDKQTIQLAVTKAIYENFPTKLNTPKYASIFNTLIEQQSAPAVLTATLNFTDAASILPNNAIDASEKSVITARVENTGKGTAFGVKLQIKSDAKNINIPESVDVGDIPPGESKSVSIPVTADAKLSAGTAAFTIKADEKRGYSARPVKLVIPTAGMQRPDLMIADCTVNDASGLASGNGDMKPENNETIELNPFIQNSGVGDALKVDVRLSDVTPGIEVLKPDDTLAAIAPNSTNKAALAFHIPRTFAASQIKYTITATDTRGLTTKKTFTLPFTPETPKLYLTYQVVNDRGEQIPALENGQSYRVRVNAKNIGDNIATDVKLNVDASAGQVEIGRFDGDIGELSADATAPVITIPLILARAYEDNTLLLNFNLKQADFPGVLKSITLPVTIKRPHLAYTVTLLNGASKTDLTVNSAPRFRVSVSNTGDLPANNVAVDFAVDRSDIDYHKKQTIGTIQPGESQYKDFQFFVRGNAETGNLPLKIDISQTDFAGSALNPTFAVKEQTAIVQTVQASAGAVVTGTAMAEPPELYVNTPNQQTETMEKIIPVHGSMVAFGTGNAMDQLHISLNGNPVRIVSNPQYGTTYANVITRQIKDNKLIFDGKISLQPGKNTLSFRGVDRNNKVCTQTLTIVKKARLGDIYAVVIGVSDFANADYNLKYAASDAEKFYHFLQSNTGGKLNDDRASLLTDHVATRARIIKDLSQFLGKSNRDDTVEIYLATHGVTGPDGMLYYLCYDTDIDNLEGTGFSDNDLTEIMRKNIHAGKVIIYLDVCHSGMSGLSERYARRGIGVLEVNQKINDLGAALLRRP